MKIINTTSISPLRTLLSEELKLVAGATEEPWGGIFNESPGTSEPWGGIFNEVPGYSFLKCFNND